jgi:UDP-N-acetyl-D-galactosamine dehydrogenase
MKLKDLKLAIIGLGYVGLPLATAFGQKRSVIGFDIDADRINALKAYKDTSLELDKNELISAKYLKYTNNFNDLSHCNCFIITVPTPIDKYNQPDLSSVISASESVSKIIKKGDIVIYESTFYPGCTEDDCVPIIEKYSGLKLNKDFYCGYSPERINPGDKKYNLKNIKKITSGSSPETADLIDELYNQIITAGTYKAESIKVAEAAKVIENTQRDLNIALINELAIIFNKMNIDTEAVLRAASTKWNFMSFFPGLVGGHCICVDPYYLTHKAQALGHHPEVILAGRKLNDNMGNYVVSQLIKAMTIKGIKISKAKILILGISFKENCADFRNSRVIDMIKELKNYNCNVKTFDPWVSKTKIKKEYNITLLDSLEKNNFDAIIIAVAHSQFKNMGIKAIRKLGKKNSLIYDLKYVFKLNQTDLRL